jgi:Putative adhesin
MTARRTGATGPGSPETGATGPGSPETGATGPGSPETGATGSAATGSAATGPGAAGADDAGIGATGPGGAGIGSAGPGSAVPEGGAPGAAGDRPRRRGVWIFLAAATAAVVVIPACLGLGGRAMRRTAEYVTPYHHAIKELRIEAGSAEVSIGTGPAGRARVFKRLHWALRKPVVRESLHGDVLYITSRCSGVGGLSYGWECGADIDVQVPAGVRVSAASGSGTINVRGVQGDLDLRTGSGQISVAGSRGALRARVGSGTIRGTGLASPDTQVNVSSGELDLRYAEPPRTVDVSADAGSVKIIVPAGSHYRVQGWTGSGDTHLNHALVDDRSDRLISVRSGSGSAYVDYRDR